MEVDVEDIDSSVHLDLFTYIKVSLYCLGFKVHYYLTTAPFAGIFGSDTDKEGGGRERERKRDQMNSKLSQYNLDSQVYVDGGIGKYRLPAISLWSTVASAVATPSSASAAFSAPTPSSMSMSILLHHWVLQGMTSADS